jgi:TetR/AcrR family transcriptional repressor of nem operon
MPATTARRSAHTASRILDVAERLLQQRGFNGFSYADIAGELGVTTATLHYHFASKANLGKALIERYAARFDAALARIDETVPDAPARLEAYARLYADVLKKRRLCLCGVLAAEYQTLPQPMREAIIKFFDDNEAWLADVLDAGRAGGTLRFAGSSSGAGRMILSGLEGAMLVARPYGDVDRFMTTASHLLASVGPTSIPAQSSAPERHAPLRVRPQSRKTDRSLEGQS